LEKLPARPLKRSTWKKRTAFKLVEGDRNQAVVNLKVDADAQTENHYNQIDDTTQTENHYNQIDDTTQTD
jgi:hypothetical protein